MRINKSKKSGGSNFLKNLAVWQKVVASLCSVAVVGGIGFGVYALTSTEPENIPVNESTNTSSEANSDTSSKTSSTADIVPPSSKEEESKPSSSETTSSKGTPSSQATNSSKPTSSTAPAASKNETKPTVSTPPAPAAKSSEGYQERFLPYFEKNTDIAGWIKLAGTKLDYPVVQGKDNIYYLDHDVYKKKDSWAVPYMDYRNQNTKDYQSTNTLIYGHSDDKRGLQLSTMKGFRKVDFYKQHPTIEFDSVYADGTYKIVAFYITNQNYKNWLDYYNFIEPSSADALNSFVAGAKARSYINTNVDVLPTDKLLTIQTCEDTNSKNFNRLVMLARKLREGEDPSVDTSSATQNTAQVLPKN